jgi:hypothetical protein
MKRVTLAGAVVLSAAASIWNRRAIRFDRSLKCRPESARRDNESFH